VPHAQTHTSPMSTSVLPTIDEMRALFRLAIPVTVVQVGMMVMGTVDSIMVGHYSAVALAAVALGNLYFFGLAIFGIGVLMALDPVVAQAVGAKDEPAIARGMQRGIVLALVLAVPSSLLLLTAGPILGLLQQPDELVPVAAGYALRVMPGVFPFLAFVSVRQGLQAMHRLAPIVVTILAANVVNAALNYIMVFGKLGIPAMGAYGSAWATSISRWLMALALLGLAWKDLKPYLTPILPESVALKPIWRMLRLGLPIGVQLQLEMTAFGAIAIFMGLLGTVQVAGHQVAINLASMTFMVPLGVSMAASVMVGNAVGRNDAVAARRYARAALFTGGGFMAATAGVFLGMPGALARIYTTDPAVLALAVSLIPIAGVFQVFDGLQVVCVGILRGLGDTRAPMVVALVGFWLIGTPVSVLLGFATPLGAQGLWWGILAGLGAVAAILLVRVRLQMRRNLSRVVIDEPQSIY